MRLREGLVLRKIGEDYVIVDPGKGMIDLSKVFTLNETAAWLWEEIKERDFDIDTLVSLVKEEYDVDDVDEDVIIKDMELIISFLKDNQLLA